MFDPNIVYPYHGNNSSIRICPYIIPSRRKPYRKAIKYEIKLCILGGSNRRLLAESTSLRRNEQKL